jgi:nucleoside-diphosphate-sugar epimerase
VLANRPILWIGGPQYKGDLVWVEDVVDAFLLCGTIDEAVGEVFNISCREPSTSLEIIQAMLDTAGNTHKIVLVPPWIVWPLITLGTRLNALDMPVEQLQYLQGDYSFSIEKARRLLGYEPRMSAAEAMVELLKGYIEDRDRVKKIAKSY